MPSIPRQLLTPERVQEIIDLFEVLPYSSLAAKQVNCALTVDSRFVCELIGHVKELTAQLAELEKHVVCECGHASNKHYDHKQEPSWKSVGYRQLAGCYAGSCACTGFVPEHSA